MKVSARGECTCEGPADRGVGFESRERAYFEQVRRHRVARSLSERCRVILRCADGLASKEVAVIVDF